MSQGDLMTEDDIVGEAGSSIETALASMVLGPILGVRKQSDSLRPLPPVYQSLSTRVSGRGNTAHIEAPRNTLEGTKEATITKGKVIQRPKCTSPPS